MESFRFLAELWPFSAQHKPVHLAAQQSHHYTPSSPVELEDSLEAGRCAQETARPHGGGPKPTLVLEIGAGSSVPEGDNEGPCANRGRKGAAIRMNITGLDADDNEAGSATRPV